RGPSGRQAQEPPASKPSPTCRADRHRLIAAPRFDRSASEGQLAEQIAAIADRDNLLLPARRGSQNLDSPADNRIKMRRRIIRRVDRRPSPERAHNVRQFAQRREAMRRACFSLAHTRLARRHHCLPPVILPRLNCYFFALPFPISPCATTEVAFAEPRRKPNRHPEATAAPAQPPFRFPAAP